MWSDPRYVAEEKIDGSRQMMYFDDDRVRFVSRGSMIDRASNFPHFCVTRPDLSGTVLDGEIDGGSFGDTISVVNSGSKESIRKQEENGRLTYRVFDCLYFKGTDIRKQPLSTRREYLLQVIRELNNPWVVLVEQVATDKFEFYKSIIARGGEGVVIKNSNLMYGSGWVKFKFRNDVSVVITKIHHSTGKLSVEMGVYDGNRIRRVGDCAATTDALVSEMLNKPDVYLGRVLDVIAYDITKDGHVRHPVFHRMRPDLAPTDCTLEKLRQDFNSR
jgi:ATP-dependent DNA ligase